ncbi:hypothetical protein ID866_10251 [Astraeus odoratus]|nr:hypothetical protein ID866_10251 [Astraeus odoratus]
MAPLRLNPHEVAQPDFTSKAHAASHLSLMGSGLIEEQAITALTNLWLINNEQEHAAWDRSLVKEYNTAEDARQATTKAEESDGTYVWKQQEDDCHSLVKTSMAKRGLKSDPLPDKKLSWEQFFEATLHMVEFMSRCQWPQDHIDMFQKFWLGIQSHLWHTSSNLQAKQALLSYQAKQQKLWHYSIGMAFSFSLTKIEEELNRMCMVGPPLPSPPPTPCSSQASSPPSHAHLACNHCSLWPSPLTMITVQPSPIQLNDAMAASLPHSTSSAPHGSSLKQLHPLMAASDTPDALEKRQQFHPPSPAKTSPAPTTAGPLSTEPTTLMVLSVCPVCLS